MPSGRSVAVVVTPPVSEPAPGSVNAQATIQSPLSTLGNIFCFSSSLAWPSGCPTHRALCAARFMAKAPQCRAISSITRQKHSIESPCPPTLAGASMPIRPVRPALVKSSRGNSSFSSQAAAKGAISCAQKPAAFFRKSISPGFRWS